MRGTKATGQEASSVWSLEAGPAIKINLTTAQDNTGNLTRPLGNTAGGGSKKKRDTIQQVSSEEQN